LLNNAGYGAYGPLEAFSRDQVLRQFNTNVIGFLDVTKIVLLMNKQKKVLLSIFPQLEAK
jgi:short-subunit dehydrogenase